MLYRLHIHPTSGHPDGLPEIHLVYRCAFIVIKLRITCTHDRPSVFVTLTYSFYNLSLARLPLCNLRDGYALLRDANSSFNFEINDSITSTVWHSDVSYELQPPGLTTFFLLSQPDTGGDTLFTSQVGTFKKLSAPIQAFLKTLKAVHSGVEQANFSRSGRRGGVVRREPVENVHPIVRRHPVTGEEALYVNKQFTRRIVGLKKEESGAYLSETLSRLCLRFSLGLFPEHLFWSIALALHSFANF